LLKKKTVSNTERLVIPKTKTNCLEAVVKAQFLKYNGQICRCDNSMVAQRCYLLNPSDPTTQDPWINIAKMLSVSAEQERKG